jgi:hypothetical protein
VRNLCSFVHNLSCLVWTITRLANKWLCGLCVHCVVSKFAHHCWWSIPVSLCLFHKENLDHSKPIFNKWSQLYHVGYIVVCCLLSVGGVSSTIVDYWLISVNSVDSGFDYLVSSHCIIIIIDN